MAVVRDLSVGVLDRDVVPEAATARAAPRRAAIEFAVVRREDGALRQGCPRLAVGAGAGLEAAQGRLDQVRADLAVGGGHLAVGESDLQIAETLENRGVVDDQIDLVDHGAEFGGET